MALAEAARRSLRAVSTNKQLNSFISLKPEQSIIDEVSWSEERHNTGHRPFFLSING
jgi:hypothetical protein